MLRLAGGLLTVLAGCLLGNSLASEQDQICLEMRYLQGLVMKLRGELWYSRTMLPEILDQLAAVARTPYAEWFSGMADAMCRKESGDLSGIWERETEKYLSNGELPSAEVIRLKELGGSMGHADIEQQIRYLDRYLEELTGALREKQRELGEKKKICRCLGITGGILITVMLI